MHGSDSFPQPLSVLQQGILAGASSIKIHASRSSRARGKGGIRGLLSHL